MRLRRTIGVLLLCASAIPGAVARASNDLPLLPGACAPEGPMDQARPASCRRILYQYGPLHITPGDNLILFGPISVEKPLEDGWVVRFKPDLIRVTGEVPNIEDIHLHHAVWISTAFSTTDPVFATGEEKTIITIPDGYGVPVRGTSEAWLLNYMIHNQNPTPENVFITYEVDFIPKAGTPAGSVRDVQPFWVDVGSSNGLNPVYNTQRQYGGADGECAYPRETCAAFDPYGKSQNGNGLGKTRGAIDGSVIWALGHVHPGGLRLELDVRRGGQTRRVFVSNARYFDPNGPVSWDMAMEVTRPSWRLRVRSGDQFVLNSFYETVQGSWYEGMGIVVMYVAPGDTTGTDPFTGSVDPADTGITHGHLAEAANHGGPDRAGAPALATVAASRVTIGGFAYNPGNGGTVVPTVTRGTPVTFVNVDAPALIFHTVTACRAPCNGATGISYPLANGEADFDSLQLGYGVPSATAAANTAQWTLQTGSMNPGTYTYFCRVHPFMRGALRIS